MSKQHLAVLILSCDKYADMWTPFMLQFRRFFPVEDYQIYFGSNMVRCNEPDIIPLLSGDDPDWSTSLKKILSQIEEPKLYVILEDLFLSSPINKEDFQAALSYLFEKDAIHINYWASPATDVRFSHPTVSAGPHSISGSWPRA
jgi:hypothetical protein